MLGSLRLPAALVLVGCVQSPPQAELGTGRTRFEPLVEGADLPFEAGPQGSHHFWVSVRARGLDPETTEIRLEFEPMATGRPRHTSIRRLDAPAADGWHHHLGTPSAVSSPECFRNRDVSIRAHLIDAEGRMARDERVVVLRWPEPLGTCER